jgi:hypothetical protein
VKGRFVVEEGHMDRIVDSTEENGEEDEIISAF